MFRRIDRSPALARFFERFTSTMARQRGLPVIIGLILVVISFIVQLVNVAVQSPILDIIGISAQHIGIIVALAGLLLSEALGS
jgi:hypothetical protein